ncbi:hypothetical protein HMPREF1090_01726 [[Clostridium] clostridioforme 90A8]|uniref:Uncharacterized protein n=1 Tax=[Clostridium] clostridioforme 90A8 TaxID=999408 RepID=A0A0E2HD95_9FIRM|nr:hypothetical protein HMPREF1090_01726 [[Clostridium] clostridioforme 90A8]
MECFLILCLTSCYAEAVLEVVDGFFYIYPDFISAVPFFGASGPFRDRHGDSFPGKGKSSFRSRMKCKGFHNDRRAGIFWSHNLFPASF